eukprot:280829-Rhodomonas_salina.1
MAIVGVRLLQQELGVAERALSAMAAQVCHHPCQQCVCFCRHQFHVPAMLVFVAPVLPFCLSRAPIDAVDANVRGGRPAGAGQRELIEREGLRLLGRVASRGAQAHGGARVGR